MSDQQLRDQAVAHLKRTTITFPRWAANVAKGVYTPRDGSGTEWGKALELLAQIGGTTPPPLPPPITTNHLGLIRLGQDISSYASRIGAYGLVVVSQGDTTISNPRTLLYVNGMKIRTDGGSGVSQQQANSLGYLTSVATPGYPALYADVALAAYQQWFAQTVVTGAKAQAAAGVFLDDLAMTPGTGVTLPGYNLDKFQTGMAGLAAGVGAACKQAGLYLLANCNAYISQVQDNAPAEASWVKRNAGALHGAMSESFMTLRDGSNTPRTTALAVKSAGWDTLVTQVESTGVDFIGLTYGPLSTALYAYASLLTQSQRPGSCFMWGADTDPATLLGRYTGTATINLDTGTGTVA